MKKFVAVGLVMCSIIVFSSCKKTTICTFTDSETGVVTTDTVKTGEMLHEEAVNQHTKNGWVCQ
ncbi:MAG: hypothetical protein JKY53_08740 [Flavobacteriales bacterium]|nr:hypothetical protein [Flavobacteriales bacterium]